MRKLYLYRVYATDSDPGALYMARLMRDGISGCWIDPHENRDGEYVLLGFEVGGDIDPNDHFENVVDMVGHLADKTGRGFAIEQFGAGEVVAVAPDVKGEEDETPAGFDIKKLLDRNGRIMFFTPNEIARSSNLSGGWDPVGLAYDPENAVHGDDVWTALHASVDAKRKTVEVWDGTEGGITNEEVLDVLKDVRGDDLAGARKRLFEYVCERNDGLDAAAARAENPRVPGNY